MENKRLEKNLVFYVPGLRGAVFTHKAGNLINDGIIKNTIEILADDVKGPIEFIEERRIKSRELS